MDNIPKGPLRGHGRFHSRQQATPRYNEYLTRPPSRWRGIGGGASNGAHEGRSPVNGYSSSGYGNPPLASGFATSLSLGPIIKQREPWQSWPELTVRVQNLPPTIVTSDLWRRFEQEGNIIFIELYENRQGLRDGNAKIRFQPPPRRDFWNADIIEVAVSNGDSGFIRVKVVAEPKKRRFEVQSPVQRTVWYPEVMALSSSALSFGVLSDPTTMLNMYTTESNRRNSVEFSVDVLRNRIVARFSVTFKQPVDDNNSIIGRMNRVNQFMFTISFAQLQKISQVNIDESQFALIMTLDSPPQFFRRRLNLSSTHSREALTWSEFDCWFRQTDIVYDPRHVKETAVALNTEVIPVIDLGRWTTYRFTFDKSGNEQRVLDMIKNALQDYNIGVVAVDGFCTISRDSIIPAPMWAMIDPPETDMALDYTLPFEVRYQLEVCLSQGIINEYNVTPEFLDTLAHLAANDQKSATHILEYVAEKEKRVYDPMAIFKIPEAASYSSKSTKIPHYCAFSRKVTITPTTMYVSSPTVETTNRVIRNYAQAHGDRFLRVQFTDEKFEGRINACADKSRNDELFSRVYRTLSNGIRIGDRHYEFLAFGNSQFRENGAYFFCPTEHLSCNDIRQWMGDFSHNRVVAKYAARLGLCFSTTRAINSIGRTHIRSIEDSEEGGYCFTDGVGKISNFLAQMIAQELNLPSSLPVPSAFQFRMGGCKGILVVWPEIKGPEIQLRRSQSKFRAVYNGLEVIRCSRYSPATLNRQTITILSSLGVEDSVFNHMLTEQLSNYRLAMTDERLALNLLSRYIDDNHMTVTIAQIISDGFMQFKEPFLLSLLHLWRSWSIKALKEKAKIIVEKGAFLLGCVDEIGVLRGHRKASGEAGTLANVNELPEVFVQIPEKDSEGKQTSRYIIIEGICALGRNPSLHPGDIRVVNAINVPALHHLRDVVVFPRIGERDIPSMCSGGDLDGDDYFVIWDENLIPTEWNAAPMDYAAPKAKELNRPVEIQDMMKFFVRYMKNDALPTIAHAHLAQSDYLDLGIKDPRCIQLAALHSKAVDYVKTGEPAEMPKHLKPRKWPHFMEKKHKPKEQIYISNKILGQLYNQVETVDFMPQYEAPFDPRILKAYSLNQTLLRTARQVKTEYDTAVRRIMAQQEIKTEFEVWTTFVLTRPLVGSDYKVQENMAHITGSLKDRFKQICIEKAGSAEFEKLGPFVAAMYQVTSEELDIALRECRTTITMGGKEVPKRKMEPKNMPLISFPWLFYNVLGKIATGIDNHRASETFGLSSLPAIYEPRRLVGDATRITRPEFADVVETAEGVTHRGEVLDLFRHDDVDSEGDEVEQPHAARTQGSPHPRLEISFDEEIVQTDLDQAHPVSGAPNPEIVENTLKPACSTLLSVANSLSLSSSLADLAVLEGDPGPQLLLELSEGADSDGKGNGQSNFDTRDARSSSLYDMKDLMSLDEAPAIDHDADDEIAAALEDELEMALGELDMTVDESPFDRLQRVAGS